MVNTAVIGAGVFGRNHARVLHTLETEGRARLAAVLDVDAERAQALAQTYGTQAYDSLQTLIASGTVQAAVVAVPTAHHAAVASALMKAGIDVLIEKPIAVTAEEAKGLEAIAAETRRVAMVGHLERFNPAVTAAQSMLTRPMFFECHRLSIFTPRSLDVDVVLDLMIHDLDVVLSMVQAPVSEVRSVGLPVLTDKVDIANVRVEFVNGCVANFTASRVSTERVRKLRLFQPHEYLSLDYARQDLIRIQVDEGMVAGLAALATGVMAAPSGEGSFGGVNISKPAVQPGEPLRAELEEFLRAVETRERPRVALEDGRRALELALEINAKMEEHRRRAGL